SRSIHGSQRSSLKSRFSFKELSMKVIQAIIQPFGCLLVLVTTLAAASDGQQRGASSYQVPQNTSIQVDVNLTLVGVTVTNRRGEYVQGLSAENFKLLEDKVEQKIEYFSAEDIPVSIGLILDISGSMKSAASVAHDATVAFLKEGNRDDEYFLVEFNERPMVAEDFTTIHAALTTESKAWPRRAINRRQQLQGSR